MVHRLRRRACMENVHRRPPHTIARSKSTWSGLFARAGLEAGGDLAVAHHQHLVRQADRLLQRVGDQQDRHALRREIADQFVDLFLGADIEPARRMVEDQDARARRHPARQHHLLLVAAAELAAGDVGARRLDAQPLDPVGGEPRAPCDSRWRRGASRSSRSASVMFSAIDRNITRPSTPPLARHIADALAHRLLGRCRSAPCRRRFSACRGLRQEAADRAHHLLAARADDAGNADDLAGADRQVDVAVGAGERRGPSPRP